MTIGWAIIIVAVLYLLDKYQLLKKALVVGTIILAVVVVGYVGLLGWDFLQEKWQDRKTQQTQAKGDIFDQAAALEQQKPKVGDPIPPGATLGDSIPAPPDGSGIAGMVGKEFPFRRVGSKEYFKAICYDEASGIATYQDPTTNTTLCKAGSILMEEVK